MYAPKNCFNLLRTKSTSQSKQPIKHASMQTSPHETPCLCAVCALFAAARYTSCDVRLYLVLDSTGFEKLEERKTCTLPPLLLWLFWRQILWPRLRQFLRKRDLIALALCSKRCQSVANAARMQPKGLMAS